MTEICPKCGAMAVLLQSNITYQETPDLGSAEGTVQLPVKVEEYRCQDPSCEHEFEKFVREPSA